MSNPLTVSISWSVRRKSKMSRLAARRAGLADLGTVAMPRWVCQKTGREERFGQLLVG